MDAPKEAVKMDVVVLGELVPREVGRHAAHKMVRLGNVQKGLTIPERNRHMILLGVNLHKRLIFNVKDKFEDAQKFGYLLIEW
jgi:hypothetical protein